ncbi:MAG: NUDIX hydrolase [Gammaproteobacteria bacterium]
MTRNDRRPAQSALDDVELAARLVAAHRPRRKLLRRVMSRSAVALYLHETRGEGVSVLMIRRADREGDPWSGHMAFPGGRKDAADRNTLQTALRETAEEVGFDAGSAARLFGRLSDIPTHARLRHGPMVITPYVFGLRERPPLEPNHEVAETVWVPLGFLAERSNREKMRWAPNGVPLELPCYLFGGRRIWGLSLMMLDELLGVLQ